MPSTTWKRQAFSNRDDRRWCDGETVIASIGQGYMLATPLQLAAATTAVGTAPPTDGTATAIDGPFSDPGWLFELKLDGYRVQAVVGDGALRLWTRKRVDAATYFADFSASARGVRRIRAGIITFSRVENSGRRW